MGDSAANPAAKATKRSKKEVGNQQSESLASRSPSTSRKKKKKTDPAGIPPDKQREKKLLESNTFHALVDDATGNPPAQQGNIQRKEKCPPIYVPNKNPAFLRPLLLDRDDPATCTFRLCTGGVKLIFDSKACYHRALEYLVKPWVEHYTHDDPATRPLKVVLRGLEDMDTEQLKLDLKENGLVPLAVHKISRRDTTRKYRDQPYLVHLVKGTATLKELQKVRTYDDCAITWERYNPIHREVTQCLRCQRFGHGMRNCRMGRRCIDCGEHHTADRCNMEPPKCANCEGGHLASSKECPKRAEFIAMRKKSAINNQPKRRKAAPVLNEANFPALQPQRPALGAVSAPSSEARQTPPSQWPANPPGFQRQATSEPLPEEDGSTLFTAEQLVTIFHQLVARLRGCKSRIDQIYALGLFVIENAF